MCLGGALIGSFEVGRAALDVNSARPWAGVQERGGGSEVHSSMHESTALL